MECPNTVPIRRDPHRRARPAPSSTTNPNLTPLRNPNLTDVPSFPLDEIMKFQLPEKHQSKNETAAPPMPTTVETLKVFLRIRPLRWPQSPRKKVDAEKGKFKGREVCVAVNNDHSVTVSPPSSLVESKRNKAEVFEGFSRVFSPNSSQNEVYESMMKPIVEEFLRGNSGMLAALGPSGSGKTHTVFGSAREPSVVPLMLREIFKQDNGSTSKSPRLFLLSMFEICSEGRREKIFDLCSDGVELGMPQSTVKGLQKVVIKDIGEAESIIACGMLKRSTAFTNTNSQSSASAEDTMTIIDLAGAERTKNQGSRLHESNFINNTSMVFGLCLRSLLEHQENPKKPLQKHFQYSMLTRYLQDYLEGKKRMALILTVKPGEDDYFDTSFFLRQACCYMDVQFHKVEEPKSLGSKRHIEAFPRVEQKKRVKSIPNDESTTVACSKDTVRDYEMMQNFAKALWKVLKEYRQKLKVVESENHDLRESLANEKKRYSDLENVGKDLEASYGKTLENITSAEAISCFESEINSLDKEQRHKMGDKATEQVIYSIFEPSVQIYTEENHQATEQVMYPEATSEPFVQIYTEQNHREKESCCQNESLGEVLKDITNFEPVINDIDSVGHPNTIVRQESCPSVEFDQLLSEEDEV